MAQTQGDALGFHRSPRWGWEGAVRRAVSPCWGWDGVVRCAASLRWGWDGVVRRAAVPCGLEARHTDGTFSELTRRVSAELFL